MNTPLDLPDGAWGLENLASYVLDAIAVYKPVWLAAGGLVLGLSIVTTALQLLEIEHRWRRIRRNHDSIIQEMRDKGWY